MTTTDGIICSFCVSGLYHILIKHMQLVYFFSPLTGKYMLYILLTIAVYQVLTNCCSYFSWNVISHLQKKAKKTRKEKKKKNK